MNHSIEQIQQSFARFLKQRFDLNDQLIATCRLTLNMDEAKQQFGDLSSNAALVLAGQLQQKPRDIAQTIATDFTHPLITKTEIAGPGFINFFVSIKTI
ncbi:MAG TPA: hypothetical protein VJ201_07105 [Candidatus Babeliales bacterium]|nr:hypothetical protein [Candidatus Babeliales bacterium]